ncbi:MAG: TldD/PmbA family protein, partial [Alphaproteobacteria bacterium]|nr:TldD/PmbA family protein [Alphaproteobacteria bacterium]
SDLGDAALAELAQRAIDMARAAPEDRFAGLAPQELLGRDPWPDLDLADAAAVSPEQLRDQARAAEDAARAVSCVTNSEGAAASAGTSVSALATSHGFGAVHGGTSHAISATVVAGEGAEKQRDHAWRQTRYAADLPAPEWIGTLAGERAVARLRPARLKSGPMTVVFDPRVGGSLLGHLVSAMSGPAIARRTSFLLDRLDEALFDASIVIEEDPLRPRGLRSRPFDGEGLATSRRRLVENGRLTGWLLDSASARQLGLSPSGHASRGGGAPGVTVGNLVLAPGEPSRDELIADVAQGVLVTELIGQGVNPVTGDYSRGASGFVIENGEIAGPVAEFTVAGNLVDMFARMRAASDLEIHHGIDTPSIRIDAMSVAGD